MPSAVEPGWSAASAAPGSASARASEHAAIARAAARIPCFFVLVGMSRPFLSQIRIVEGPSTCAASPAGGPCRGRGPGRFKMPDQRQKQGHTPCP